VILYPAHGAGSVCGSGMAEREFSTIGYESANNPDLQFDSRDAFVDYKINENLKKAPYFGKMEEMNQHGAPLMELLPDPAPMPAEQFEKALAAGMTCVDLRSPEAFAGAFIPGSLAIPLEMISAYAGYFLAYDRPIGLVADSRNDIAPAVRQLIRIGFTDIAAYLEGGLHSWEMAGKRYDRIAAVHVDKMTRRVKEDEDFTLLDVREAEELRESGHFPNALNIFLGDLPDRIDDVPDDKPVTTFCGSGMRAIIAASILKRNGFEQVENNLGSMAACQAIGCPIVDADA
jgi:hydroxyacylglutathione hydrolase